MREKKDLLKNFTKFTSFLFVIASFYLGNTHQSIRSRSQNSFKIAHTDLA